MGIIYCEIDDSYIIYLKELLEWMKKLDVSVVMHIFKNKLEYSEFKLNLLKEQNESIENKIKFYNEEIKKEEELLKNNKIVITDLKNKMNGIKEKLANDYLTEKTDLEKKIETIKDERKKVKADLLVKIDEENKKLNVSKGQLFRTGIPEYKIKEFIPLVEKPVGREYEYVWHHIDPILPYVVPCTFLGIIGIDYRFLPGLFKQFEID